MAVMVDQAVDQQLIPMAEIQVLLALVILQAQLLLKEITSVLQEA
jgi:hypothetical protein